VVTVAILLSFIFSRDGSFDNTNQFWGHGKFSQLLTLPYVVLVLGTGQVRC
jgi:hypothetical protein